MARILTPRQANQALRALPDLAKTRVQSEINETASKVADGARRRAPILTGRLRGSITSNARPRSVSAVAGVSARRGGVTRGEVFEGERQDPFYWKFIEYGTVKMSARPMFRPAAMEVENDHRIRMISALSKAADEMDRQV